MDSFPKSPLDLCLIFFSCFEPFFVDLILLSFYLDPSKSHEEAPASIARLLT